MGWEPKRDHRENQSITGAAVHHVDDITSVWGESVFTAKLIYSIIMSPVDTVKPFIPYILFEAFFSQVGSLIVNKIWKRLRWYNFVGVTWFSTIFLSVKSSWSPITQISKYIQTKKTRNYLIWAYFNTRDMGKPMLFLVPRHDLSKMATMRTYDPKMTKIKKTEKGYFSKFQIFISRHQLKPFP